jgi:hypothetical protein
MVRIILNDGRTDDLKPKNEDNRERNSVGHDSIL